jgi:AbiTii
VSKLSEIIDAATEETASIPSLLRKLKVVASRLETALLLDWVDNELTGYTDPDVLPPQYRGPFPTEVVAQWAGPGGSHATMPLPSIALPEPMRKAPYELVFRQSVSELEKLAESDDLLMHEWHADAVARVNAMVASGQIQPEIPMGTLVHAYRRFSPALLTAILDAVRTRVLNVALDLERLVPQAGEADAPPADPALVQLVVTNWGQGSGIRLR